MFYYPSSENKGADQLRGYREADLRLCFRICKLLVFSRRGSNCVHTRLDLISNLTLSYEKKFAVCMFYVTVSLNNYKYLGGSVWVGLI